MQVDLGSSVPIDEIRLIPARPTDFPDTPGFGFPARYRVELSDSPGLRRARRSWTSATAARPPQRRRRAIRHPTRRPARGAIVRVAASRLWKRTGDYVFALAEIEVISRRHERRAGEGRDLARLDRGGPLVARQRWSTALTAGPPAPTPPARSPRRAELRYQLRQAEQERERQADALLSPTLRADRRNPLRRGGQAIDDEIAALKPTEVVYTVVPHEPRPIHVLKRGDVEQPGEVVGPGALSCLAGLDSAFALSDPDDEGARRAALAGWIASPDNVLTWRSIANRVWQYHFGRGIVDTPNDFGRNGSLPTHPELLDWLAVELKENGQSLKALHRLIVRSAAYRQSSRSDPARAAKDADNRWLWRQNRQRLDAESVRDSILLVSGTLDDAMGGPGFALFQFKDDHSPIYDHAAPGVADNPAVRRRTVYRFVVRSVPNPFLECLDGADPNINIPVRSTTITALQALALLNDDFIVSQSKALAARLERERGDDPGRIERAYRLALSRPPRPDEKAALVAYARKFGLPGACRVLLNTNEFMFVD